MNDTPRHVADMMTQLIMQKTPTQRMEMASSMYATARTLVEAGLLKDNPNLNRAQLRARVFLRFYGQDFSVDQIAQIMKNIPDMQEE